MTSHDVPVAWPLWSPTGGSVALTRTADWSTGPLVVVNVKTGALAEVEPLSGGMLRARAFAPSGGAVLVTTTNSLGFQQLALVGPRTGRTQLIGPADHDVAAAVWSGDHGIVFTQNIGGQSAISRMRHPSAEVERLLAPRGVIDGLVMSDHMLFFPRTDSASPPGLWRLSVLEETPVALVAPAATDLLAARPFEFQSFDGRTIRGFLYEPLPPGPHPTVAFVHGGPDGQSKDEFSAQKQALAQAGFVVVDVNYRGSTGYGQAFTDLDNHDWGGGDRKDIRMALERLAKEGIVDLQRVGIMGGSFGGYLTLMALCLDSDLYRAGVDMYGMPDLVLDYEMTKDRYADWYAVEMGSPETHRALFISRSPMSLLDKLVAPLMVLHGDNDSDVPKAQSDALVTALRNAGRPPEYVVYPNEGHAFSGRAVRRDVLDRTVAFFRKHLQL